MSERERAEWRAQGRRLVWVFGCALAAIGIVTGATAGGGPGSAFGEGLRLTNTAWALGISESMVASGTGVSAISINPAGVLDASVTTLHLTHSFFVEDLAEDYFAFSQRLPFGSALGVSVHGLYDSSSERTLEDASGNYAGEAGGYPSGFVGGGLAYALNLNPFLGPMNFLNGTGGLGVRVVWQRIEKREWLGISFDLGAKIRPGYGFTIGGVLQNAGAVSGSSHLPLQWVTGIAWEKHRTFHGGDQFLIEVDSPVAVDRDLSFRVGSEYRVRMGKVAFAVRGGWKQDMEVLDSPGLTAGFGFRWMMGFTPWGMDYAYVPWGVFGNLHAVSLTVGLIPPPAQPPPPKLARPKEPPFVFFPLERERARYTITVPRPAAWVSAVLLDEDGNFIDTILPLQVAQPGEMLVEWDGLRPSGRPAEYEKIFRIRIRIGDVVWYKDVMPKKERE